jgi:hypothetical protein
MPKHTQEFQFSICDTVWIKDINTRARVELLQVDFIGIQYRVSYWLNGKRENTWVYADEITELE